MGILSKIGRLFKKLWDAIRKILAILLIIIAVILIVWAAVLSGGAALVLFGFAISQTAAFVIGALALVGAFLLDSETANEVVGKIGDAMGDAAGAVGGVIGDVVGGGITGILGSSGGMLIVGGIALYFLLSSGKSKNEPVQAKPPKGKQADDGKKKTDAKGVSSVKQKSNPVQTNGSEKGGYYGSIPLLA